MSDQAITLPPHWLEDGVGIIPDWASTSRANCPQRGVYHCTRDLGHPGRHIAGTGEALLEAWPGTDPPVRADLSEADS